MLFHGATDDAVIGGIWNPQMQRRTFRARLPSSYRPAGGSAKANKKNPESDEEEEESEGSDGINDDVVEINKEAIVAEIARIGGDMVAEVELVNASGHKRSGS